MGIKHIDSIGEKKDGLGSHALTKKGLRQAIEYLTKINQLFLGSHALTKKGLRH